MRKAAPVYKGLWNSRMTIRPPTESMYMAGKGPAPMKARDQKRRPNATSGFKRLPHEGRSGDPPVWPLPELDDSQLAALEAVEWARVWGLPQAVEWERMRCETLVAMYVRVFVKASLTGGDTKLLSEMRQLDAKIGLSPRAMMDLRWETDDAPFEEEDDPAVPVPIGQRIYVPKAEPT